MTRKSNSLLRDLGEQRIVDELIKPRFPTSLGFVIGIGDDCAMLPPIPGGDHVVVTIDPCPTPVACLLDPTDYYHYGWLTVVINVSDLAAVGASPLGMTVSTVMRPDMSVREYERFLDGLADGSKTFDCPVVGGNIKDGQAFDAVGSAFGSVSPAHVMRRTGLKEGDRICVVGEMGLFWAAVLAKLGGAATLPPALSESLYRPVAKIKEGIALARQGVVTACIDSSDGVGASLRELALRNGRDIVVDAVALQPHPEVVGIARSSGVDAYKLMLAWGNWELVCTVAPSGVRAAGQIVASLGGRFLEIGEVTEGTGTVWLRRGRDCAPLADFGSTRFTESSYFTHGLSSYVDVLKHRPLTTAAQSDQRP